MPNRPTVIALTAFSALLILSALGYGLLRISRSRSFQFFGTLIERVETDQKIVALTFDDAPTERTDDVLKVLAHKGAVATFYAVGAALEQFPDKGRAIVQQGSELGNHSYSHQRFLLKPQKFIADEIQKTNKLIRDAGYVGEITFRPPYGKKLLGLPWYLDENHIVTVTWDVEPDTYADKNAQAITDYVMANAKPGSIILMHPFCEGDCEADREALPMVIDGLRNKGYSLVTVSRLLNQE